MNKDSIKKLGKRGFSLLEILVVIAIVGLLASVILASVQVARQRAQAARTISDFRQIELALRVLINVSERDSWWHSNDFTLCSDTWQVPISCLVNNYGLYFETAPVPVLGSHYTYHNSYNGGNPYQCGHNEVWRGVNISLREVDNDSGFVELMDRIIDSGDGDDCGRIRWNQSGPDLNFSLYWMIGTDSQDY